MLKDKIGDREEDEFVASSFWAFKPRSSKTTCIKEDGYWATDAEVHEGDMCGVFDWKTTQSINVKKELLACIETVAAGALGYMWSDYTNFAQRKAVHFNFH